MCLWFVAFCPPFVVVPFLPPRGCDSALFALQLSRTNLVPVVLHIINIVESQLSMPSLVSECSHKDTRHVSLGVSP